MRTIIAASIALVLMPLDLAVSAPPASLPQAMFGTWSTADDKGDMRRVPDGSDDQGFWMHTNKYGSIESECDVKEIEKLGNSYTVHGRCHLIEVPAQPPWDDVTQFELHGDTLHMEDVDG